MNEDIKITKKDVVFAFLDTIKAIKSKDVLKQLQKQFPRYTKELLAAYLYRYRPLRDEGIREYHGDLFEEFRDVNAEVCDRLTVEYLKGKCYNSLEDAMEHCEKKDLLGIATKILELELKIKEVKGEDDESITEILRAISANTQAFGE